MTKRDYPGRPHKAKSPPIPQTSAPPAKIRVMIVEDSVVIREFLAHIIGSDPRFEIVAAVESGEEALTILTHTTPHARRLQHHPDVITMDIRLPGMNGFEATRRIMSERPTPIVVVSASVESENLNISMNALRAGALAVLEKPVGTTHHEYQVLADKLCTQLAIMSQVKVVRQRLRPVSGPVIYPPIPQPDAMLPCVGAVGIVASTGGPNALLEVLNRLPVPFPVPILIVQHMTASFMRGFIEWLAQNCPFQVLEAQTGQIPKAGCVYVAPAAHHLCLRERRLLLEASPPVCIQCPSGTVLFKTMAEDLGPAALGVLLTGMGEDGAEGLAEIRTAGGYTITEHESTAVVYGMPAAAVALGASCESLSLPDIGPRVAEVVMGGLAGSSTDDAEPAARRSSMIAARVTAQG